MEPKYDLTLRLQFGEQMITIGGASSAGGASSGTATPGTASPGVTPYHLLASGITGTEAAEAVVEAMEQTPADGGVVLSRHLSGRELTLQFEIADYENRERYRRELISFFDPAADGTLTVIRRGEDGQTVTRSCACMLSGRMTMTQENLYSYIRVRVPLYCPDPYFYSDTGQVQAARTVEPLLTFPLTVTENAGALGGLIRCEDTLVINNTGDAPTGFVLSLRAIDHGGTAGLVNPMITREEDGAYIRLLTTLAVGDTLTVSTVPGAKYVLKNGENALFFDRGSTFFPLLRGVNTLRISSDAMLEPPDTVISYRCRYFGA